MNNVSDKSARANTNVASLAISFVEGSSNGSTIIVINLLDGPWMIAKTLSDLFEVMEGLLCLFPSSPIAPSLQERPAVFDSGEHCSDASCNSNAFDHPNVSDLVSYAESSKGEGSEIKVTSVKISDDS